MLQANLRILQQGDIAITSVGYGLIGNDDAVCFFIDVEPRAYVDCSSASDNDCPVVFIARDISETLTEVEFCDYPGWRFHAGGSGKSIAIALVRKGAEQKEWSMTNNMDGAKEFIHALLLNQPIWPNDCGQDVAAAAFFVNSEREKIKKEIKQAIPAMREFARNNPPHKHNGIMQDPLGVHAWLSRNDPSIKDEKNDPSR